MTARWRTVGAMLLGVVVFVGCAASRTRHASSTATTLAPTGEVADPWNGPLRGALAGCDSLEVFVDGLPRVLAVEGADHVEEIVAMIRIDPARSGQAFCCTGDATFTFARQGTHRASLQSLYGMGWRWSHGPWEADAVPTIASALALSRWLSECGVPIDLDELERDLEAQQRRIDRERAAER